MSKALLKGVLAELVHEIPAYLCSSLCGVEYSLIRSRLEKFLAYTTVGGKLARSCLVYDSYSALKPDATRDELAAASQVAATLELYNTFLITVDDIIDGAEIRRANRCWWRLPEVGLSAINDALLLDNSIDWVVRRAIPQHPKLSQILLAIWKTRQNTCIGEMLDCLECRVEDLTWARYFQIIERKAADYSYYLPLLLGYHLAEVPFDEPTLRSVANKLGYMFQAQNDVIDCYCPSAEELGKSCDDLAEGKCTWVACRAFEKLRTDSPARRDAFLSHFGRAEKEHVEAAVAMVRELGIREDYERYRDTLADQLHSEIEAWSGAPLPMKQMLYATIERTKLWPHWA